MHTSVHQGPYLDNPNNPAVAVGKLFWSHELSVVSATAMCNALVSNKQLSRYKNICEKWRAAEPLHEAAFLSFSVISHFVTEIKTCICAAHGHFLSLFQT